MDTSVVHAIIIRQVTWIQLTISLTLAAILTSLLQPLLNLGSNMSPYDLSHQMPLR